jgi:hypothetical protein
MFTLRQIAKNFLNNLRVDLISTYFASKFVRFGKKNFFFHLIL